MRSTAVLQRDRLAVQDDRVHRERENGIDDLGYAIRDVREAAGERANLASEPVNLQARAVELPLDRGGRQALEGMRRGPRPSGRASA